MSEFVEVKVSELSGAALDWAVAQVEQIDGLVIHKGRPSFEKEFDPDCWADDSCLKAFKCWKFYAPSTDWSQGGPLIEKHAIGFVGYDANNWQAFSSPEDVTWQCVGPTHLIAACRVIVAAKLGETVQIPKELIQ